MQSPIIAECAFLILVALAAPSLPAQTTAPAPAPGAGKRIGQEPCWQEAGVPRSAVAQRRGIERATKTQVATVCADSALTPQQKRAKIREIRQRARQQVEALVSPEQQEAIRSCEESRGGMRHAGGGMRHAGGGMPRAKGTGPCGEMPAPGANPPTAPPPPSESAPRP
jgi:hypothetical protein